MNFTPPDWFQYIGILSMVIWVIQYPDLAQAYTNLVLWGGK